MVLGDELGSTIKYQKSITNRPCSWTITPVAALYSKFQSTIWWGCSLKAAILILWQGVIKVFELSRTIGEVTKSLSHSLVKLSTTERIPTVQIHPWAREHGSYLWSHCRAPCADDDAYAGIVNPGIFKACQESLDEGSWPSKSIRPMCSGLASLPLAWTGGALLHLHLPKKVMSGLGSPASMMTW